MAPTGFLGIVSMTLLPVQQLDLLEQGKRTSSEHTEAQLEAVEG